MGMSYRGDGFCLSRAMASSQACKLALNSALASYQLCGSQGVADPLYISFWTLVKIKIDVSFIP